MKFVHTPVLLKETIEALNAKAGMTVIDATAGGGGHSREIAKKLGTNGTLICIDQDVEAINAIKNEKFVTAKTHLINSNFSQISQILSELNIDNTDAILADLGVSSHQIDTNERGFSYTKDAPLDMRMDTTQKRDAYHVVNNYTSARLLEVIENYGEERFAKRITEAIVKARPIKTTGQLAKIIQEAVPGNYYKTGGHPAKRTFQAIRIEVNRELEILEKFVTDAAKSLKIGGRLAIITFHSLEDRIIKQTMKQLSLTCTCPPKSPKCICNTIPLLKVITKKPILPTTDEISNNPRAASAKLRIAEKI